VEAGCSKLHKEAVVSARFEDTLRTLVVSGRPLRVRMNEYIKSWEDRPEDIKRLTESGVVPMQKDMDDDKDVDLPYLMGTVAGVIEDIKPAKGIVEDMVREAVDMLKRGQSFVARDSRL
jgi:NAD(P)H-dependent flavin oxidoreductase YrpB (nitropropane dioxygenase family)